MPAGAGSRNYTSRYLAEEIAAKNPSTDYLGEKGDYIKMMVDSYSSGINGKLFK